MDIWNPLLSPAALARCDPQDSCGYRDCRDCRAPSAFPDSDEAMAAVLDAWRLDEVARATRDSSPAACRTANAV